MKFKTLVIIIFLLAVMWIVPTTNKWLNKAWNIVVNAFNPSQEEVIKPEDDLTGEEDIGDNTEGNENEYNTEGGEYIEGSMSGDNENLANNTYNGVVYLPNFLPHNNGGAL